jgi:hypothetical protein
VRELSPEDRELFERVATPLYDDLVTAGGMAQDDPRLAEEPTASALALLLELGLLVLDKRTQAYEAVDPSTVQSRVVSPMSQAGARMISESAGWANAFAPHSQAWRRAPGTESGPFTHVHSSAIDPFIAGLVAECEEEMLTAQPQTGRDAQTLQAAARRDVAMLERGTKMRTLYQHAARRSAITRDYVASVTERGGEVRTLDEFFNRLIIFDRRVAVIPGAHEDLLTALAIREPSVVDYLVDVFERAWERGRPFTSKDSRMLKDIAAEQRSMTIRMLIQGHPDPASAKRLGVSPRTYAGYIADLKAEQDVETRFQLGYAMGKQGLSGDEGSEEA